MSYVVLHDSDDEIVFVGSKEMNNGPTYSLRSAAIFRCYSAAKVLQEHIPDTTVHVIEFNPVDEDGEPINVSIEPI